MRRRQGGASGSLLAFFVFLLAIPLYMLMEHPWLFWLVFLPLAVIFVFCTIQWVKTGGMGFKYAKTAILALLLLTAVVVISPSCDQCEHEETRSVYLFETSTSRKRQYCKECNEKVSSTKFTGTPTDQSYLGILQEHTDGEEILAGEYYTVTAIVSEIDYSSDGRTRIRCKVENEDILVGFYVEFREGFEEAVDLLEEENEITFRGRFYDEGCGFTDCELVEN